MQSYTQLAIIEKLCERDFVSFYSSFRKVVEKHLPPFDDLLFVKDLVEVQSRLNSTDIKQFIQNESLQKSEADRGCCIGSSVFLSFSIHTGRMYCIVTGVDSYFTSKVSSDWLDELSLSCRERFVWIKKAGTDFETGLPNGMQFFSDLRHLSTSDTPSVFLVEVVPKSASATEAMRHTAKSLLSLRGCIGNLLPIYYLGNHVFALISISKKIEKLQLLGAQAVRRFRHEGFHRIHIGMRLSSAEEHIRDMVADPGELFEQAWSSLHSARGKGPYGWCEYDQLAHPNRHPLRKPSQSLFSKFNRMSRGEDDFSLVLLAGDPPPAVKTLTSLFRAEQLLVDGTDVYVYYPGVEPDNALGRIEKVLKKRGVKNIHKGVAGYPYLHFSRSSTLYRCRKALLHAAFYGANGSAVFDSLSLNVSGDIYYSEGNLRAAAAEYREGLKCAPENINLLNSLGVSYGDMNKRNLANRCFAQVLALDSQDFMALYNSGLGAEMSGRIEDAVHFYERARKVSTGFAEALEDINFHLGKLYCDLGSYGEAVQLLTTWYLSDGEGKNKERVFPLLGRVFFHLGDYEQAQKWLQKALVYDEFDAMSMGYLGIIFLERNEGVDISLSLCEKSLELEPDNLLLRIYFARVQIACSMTREARLTLRRCLQKKDIRDDAQLLMCRSYIHEGKKGRARYWLDKFMSKMSGDEKIVTEARQMRKEINGI